MSVVTLAGAFDGRLALVDEQGRVAVAALPPLTDVDQSSPTAPSGTSGQVVAARSGRTGLLIQNLGAVPVHLSFADSSRPATATDLMIAPGGTFEMSCRARYEGAVQAIGVGATSQLAVVEYYTD